MATPELPHGLALPSTEKLQQWQSEIDRSLLDFTIVLDGAVGDRFVDMADRRDIDPESLAIKALDGLFRADGEIMLNEVRSTTHHTPDDFMTLTPKLTPCYIGRIEDLAAEFFTDKLVLGQHAIHMYILGESFTMREAVTCEIPRDPLRLVRPVRSRGQHRS